jgi:hypothetical protein
VNQFLRAAQEGNVSELMRLYRAGVDVNSADDYGWTALMCAVKAEKEEAVESLLSVGANPLIRDKHGISVHKLLDKCKNEEVVNLFHQTDSDTEDVPLEPFFCELCGGNFMETESAHCHSTLHLFNLGKPTKDRATYGIPESNKGYQMMLRSGWDDETGLGSEGQGQQFPVKTILKRDRKGLGKDKSIKAKVTHFGPNDVKAVETRRVMRERTVKKQDRMKQLGRQRRKEMQFRMEFHME